LTAFSSATSGHARLILVVFAYVKLNLVQPQLPRKPAWRDARVKQLRRQHQAVGGVLADTRQAHLRQMNRSETLVAAFPVFRHTAQGAEYRLRNLLP
jgi:hypothetical protein